MNDEERITYFAETDYRNQKARFGIKMKDRARHMYVIGKTGMGKSTVLENMAAQDIANGEGVALIDPHGSFAEKMLDYVPEHRIKDVVYFAPFDIENPISFNVLEDVGPDKRHLVAAGLMSTFKKIWQDAWSARMEYILINSLLALLEYPNATLMGVNKMLADKEFRKKVVDNVSDPSVKSFWVDEFAKYTERMAAEAVPAIQNKIGQFTANPLIRNIIGQEKSSFDVREVMDQKKILIINLSKGRIGESNANLLGGMLITKIYLGAMSRADLTEGELKKLPPLNFFVDEFQSFASESFAGILSEARKYKLHLTIAHQYVEQMVEEVRSAVFGNVGTMIVFRVGSTDAEIFEKEFSPTFTSDDIVNLGLYQMYLRLMINGVGSKPFSARGLAPIPRPAISYREEIIAYSQRVNARPRAEVEAAIARWHEETSEKPRRDVPREGAGEKREWKDNVDRLPRKDFPPRDGAAPYTPRPSTDRPASAAPYTPTASGAPVQSTIPPRPFTRPPQNSNTPRPQPARMTPGQSKLKDILTKLESGELVPVEEEKTNPVVTPQATTIMAQSPAQVETAFSLPTPPPSAPVTAPLRNEIRTQTPHIAEPVKETPVPVKPAEISLSALTQKKPIDTKSTGKNSNQLQEALARAMAQKKPQADTSTASSTIPVTPQSTPVQAPVMHDQPPAAPKVVSTPPPVFTAPVESPKRETLEPDKKNPVREVPEDVLRKVLE